MTGSSIQRLAEELQRDHLVGGEEILDYLWCARWIGLAESVPAPEVDQPETKAPDDTRPPHPERLPPVPESKHPPQVTPPPGPVPKVVELEVPETELFDAGGARSGVDADLPVRQLTLPGARPFRNSEALARALRPLRMGIDQFTDELDEDGTIERWLETGILLPHFQTRKASPFRITVVQEAAGSSRFWSAWVEDWLDLLRKGTRAPVERLFLHPPETGDGGTDWKLSRLERARPTIGGRFLSAPSPRRLVLWVTDFASPYWRSGHLFQIAARWARRHPVSLLTPLSRNLQRRTVLKSFDERFAHCQELGRSRWLDRDLSGKGRPMFLLRFDPAAIENWARVVTGHAATGHLAVAWDEQVRPPALRTEGPLSPLSTAEIDVLVDKVRRNVTPAAFLLVQTLAAAPLTAGIMRLVQRALYPWMNHEVLAEVLFSGLIYRRPHQADVEPDKVQYEFRSGDPTAGEHALRDALFNGPGNSFDKAEQVQRVVGDYLAQHFGPNPFGIDVIGPAAQGDGSALTEELIPLARVLSHVWQQFDGERAKEGIKLHRILNGERVEEEAPQKGLQAPSERPEVEETLAETPIDDRPARFENSVGMTMLGIPSGTFTMGSPADEPGRDDDDFTQHQVTLSDPFRIAQTPVTQKQWRDVMGTTVAEQKAMGNDYGDVTGTGDDHPVYFVSWEDALRFCDRLTETENRHAEGFAYALPTEAQWEYACLAGTADRRKFLGADYDELGWFMENSAASTHPVRRKRANSLDLHDCNGNVWEWCSDNFEDTESISVSPAQLSSKLGMLSLKVLAHPQSRKAKSYLRDLAHLSRSEIEWTRLEVGGPRIPKIGSQFSVPRTEDTARKISALAERQRVHSNNVGPRSARGGAWNESLSSNWAKGRVTPDSFHRYHNIGFRPVLSPVKQREAQGVLPPGPEAVAQPKPEVKEQAAQSVRPHFVPIKAGTFLMGSPENEEGRLHLEDLHEVTLTRDFEIADAPVTQAQYEAVMGSNPSNFKESGPDTPVEMVTWEDAIAFCAKLSAEDPEWIYRLPTEAEWEYACRAGTSGPYNVDEADLKDLGWYGENWQAGTHPVRQKQPNAWDLHDCHGNVAEWCQDWLTEHLGSKAVKDPQGPERGAHRVLRGGCYDSDAQGCRSASRNNGLYPDLRTYNIGFRPVRMKKAEGTELEAVAKPESAQTLTSSATARSVAWIARDFDVPAVPGMKMLCIGAGNFIMGEGTEAHPVNVTKHFFLAETPVTQSQYEAVMGDNPSRFKEVGSEAPVEQVSWDDAMAFCAKLNQIAEPEDGWEWSLPTEAQWEYACRAGTTTAFSFGDVLNGSKANCDGSVSDRTQEKGPYLRRTSAVRSYPANAWGLYDCHGNVWEWCVDQAGGRRVVRGGSWFHEPQDCRSASRSMHGPRSCYHDFGFRPVLTRKKKPKGVVGHKNASLLTMGTAKAGKTILLNRLMIRPVFVPIPAGKFLMGSPRSEKDRSDDETQHEVTLTRAFEIADAPVTQAQYQAVIGTNPSHFKESGADAPVEQVSWDDAVQWCRKMSEGDPLFDYRLPTEAEWEYACRAGTTTPFHLGSKLNGTEANCDGNFPYGTTEKGTYLKRTSAVRSYPPNSWKLYDCHGNVLEWCADWFGEYPTNAVTDPQGPVHGERRVLRGGCWIDAAQICRSANRDEHTRGHRTSSIGFRPVRMKKAQAAEPNPATQPELNQTLGSSDNDRSPRRGLFGGLFGGKR